MENWNRHEWQGRSRQNVNFSSGVSAISIGVVLILILIAPPIHCSEYKDCDSIRSPHEKFYSFLLVKKIIYIVF